MILTNRFVVFHVPKTGGTWLRKQLVEAAPTSWHVRVNEAHWTDATLRLMNPELVTLPRIAFVRNPFDLYVSLYSFWKAYGGFEEQTRNFQTLLYFLVSTRGTLTGWLDAIKSVSSPLYIGRFENLRADALRLISEHAEVPEQLRARFESAPPLNTSQHHHYRDYYSAELRALIERVDATALEHFDYAF